MLDKLRWTTAMLAPVFLVLLTGCPSDTGLVFVPDDGLEAAIREALGKYFGTLTQTDLLELQALDARDQGVRSLIGLEFAPNLLWLDLDTNEISDLTPLANLINLQYLNLDDNQITDLTPLAGLFALDQVSLFNNQIADIHALVVNAANGGLGAGDTVILDANTLGDKALAEDVPELTNYGVNVILAEPAR